MFIFFLLTQHATKIFWVLVFLLQLQPISSSKSDAIFQETTKASLYRLREFPIYLSEGINSSFFFKYRFYISYDWNSLQILLLTLGEFKWIINFFSSWNQGRFSDGFMGECKFINSRNIRSKFGEDPCS